MDAAVECTHCKVLMTSWSAKASPVRYYQCPFCARTFSSLDGEVFRRRAGARLVAAPIAEPPPSAIPMPSPDDIRWAGLKARAARWFARLEAEERSAGAAGATPARSPAAAAVVARAAAPKRAR